MAWRVITIENPARLSLRDNKIVIEQEQTAQIPLEDIDTLVLDNYAVSVSANLLNELARSDVATILCDEKHLPCAEILPLSQHSRQAKISRAQLAMGAPLKKQIWQKIIIQKITNQATVLAKFDFRDVAASLEKLARAVKSGDATNRESVAARLYFSALLDDATRRKPIWHNAALNYGYAIVRGCLARSVAARGLVASQGIFHRSELNGFNLVDDLLEPFRAAVDDYVLRVVSARHIGDSDASLTKSDRNLIVDILNQYVIMEYKKFSVKHAADLMVESFVKTVQAGAVDSLSLPKIN